MTDQEIHEMQEDRSKNQGSRAYIAATGKRTEQGVSLLASRFLCRRWTSPVGLYSSRRIEAMYARSCSGRRSNACGTAEEDTCFQETAVMGIVPHSSTDLPVSGEQKPRNEDEFKKVPAVGLIRVFQGKLNDALLYAGLLKQFPWAWTWKSVSKRNDFLVQFPSIVKLKMVIELRSFKLIGSDATIIVENGSSEPKRKGMLYTVWIIGVGVPRCMRHHHGICEVGSLVGFVEDVDVDILDDLDIVRFKADVNTIENFPVTKEFVFKHSIYDITFVLECANSCGTLQDNVDDGEESATRYFDLREVIKNHSVDSYKKRKNTETINSNGYETPEVVMSTEGTLLMPHFDCVMNISKQPCNVFNQITQGKQKGDTEDSWPDIALSAEHEDDFDL